jgi:hypothetical protein
VEPVIVREVVLPPPPEVKIRTVKPLEDNGVVEFYASLVGRVVKKLREPRRGTMSHPLEKRELLETPEPPAIVDFGGVVEEWFAGG